MIKQIKDDGVLIEDDNGNIWFYQMTPKQLADMHKELIAAFLEKAEALGIVQVEEPAVTFESVVPLYGEYEPHELSLCQEVMKENPHLVAGYYAGKSVLGSLIGLALKKVQGIDPVLLHQEFCKLLEEKEERAQLKPDRANAASTHFAINYGKKE